MKTIKTVLTVLLLSLSLVQAQTPVPMESGGSSSSGEAPTPMPGITHAVIPVTVSSIRSPDVLRNEAMRSVIHGSRFATSSSMDWNYPGLKTYTEADGANAEEVLAKLFGTTLIYRQTNPDDKITGYVYLHDADGNLIVYGESTYTEAQASGKDKPGYVLSMQNVPILNNILSAEVLAQEEDGKTVRHYPISVNEYGQVMFPPYMAGAVNGILVVRSKDGGLTSYNLKDPIATIPGTTTDNSSEWTIPGHHVYAPAGGPQKVIKIIALWELPTVYIEVGVGETVVFDVSGLVQMDGTQTFERSPSFTYVQDNGPSAGIAPLSPFGTPTLFTFPTSGNFRLTFDWINFGYPNTLYTGPEFPIAGDEKGN